VVVGVGDLVKVWLHDVRVFGPQVIEAVDEGDVVAIRVGAEVRQVPAVLGGREGLWLRGTVVGNGVVEAGKLDRSGGGAFRQQVAARCGAGLGGAGRGGERRGGGCRARAGAAGEGGGAGGWRRAGSEPRRARRANCGQLRHEKTFTLRVG